LAEADHRMLRIARSGVAPCNIPLTWALVRVRASPLCITVEDEDEGSRHSAVWDSIFTVLLSLAKERCPIPRAALKVPAIRKYDPWPRSLLRTLAQDN
jgi:hypothetical protein